MKEGTEASWTAAQSPRMDQRMDEIMSLLLRTGVLTAAFFVLLGGTLYLAGQSRRVPDYHVFRGEPETLRSVSGIVHEALKLRGPELIQFGLLVLIATPIARVMFSLLAFLYERDRAYVVFTLIVLGLLLYSLLGRHG
jgi:uncharacterized membrane protein